jgi:hypothetical protein
VGRAGLEWSHVGTQPPFPALAPQSAYIGESRTACGWGRGRMPGTHLGGVVGEWGGWDARLSPHPPTQPGLEWSHVGVQHPCPALALQSTYTEESRTACGWGRGRLPGTHLGGVVGWVGWLGCPESPPTHTTRAGVVTCWDAAPLSRPRPAVYMHRGVADGVRVGSRTHGWYTPWCGRGWVGWLGCPESPPTHPHTQGWSGHMLVGSVPVPPLPCSLHT